MKGLKPYGTTPRKQGWLIPEEAKLKETIYRMYGHNAPPLSTSELATLLSLDRETVRRMVRELNVEGKLGYCESFGSSDSCYSLPTSSEPTRGLPR